MSHIRYPTFPYESGNRLLVEHSHVENVELVAMQMNRVRYGIVDINSDQLDNRVEFKFYKVHAPAGG